VQKVIRSYVSDYLFIKGATLWPFYKGKPICVSYMQNENSFCYPVPYHAAGPSPKEENQNKICNFYVIIKELIGSVKNMILSYHLLFEGLGSVSKDFQSGGRWIKDYLGIAE